MLASASRSFESPTLYCIIVCFKAVAVAARESQAETMHKMKMLPEIDWRCVLIFSTAVSIQGYTSLPGVDLFSSAFILGCMLFALCTSYDSGRLTSLWLPVHCSSWAGWDEGGIKYC